MSRMRILTDEPRWRCFLSIAALGIVVLTACLPLTGRRHLRRPLMTEFAERLRQDFAPDSTGVVLRSIELDSLPWRERNELRSALAKRLPTDTALPDTRRLVDLTAHHWSHVNDSAVLLLDVFRYELPSDSTLWPAPYSQTRLRYVATVGVDGWIVRRPFVILSQRGTWRPQTP